MADPTLQQLLDVEDDEAALSFLLTQLSAVGFPVANWASGGMMYSILRVLAKGLSNVMDGVSKIAAGGLLDLAEGPWLTLLAHHQFDIDRFLATFAEGTVTLTVASGAGPYTLTPGASIIYETNKKLRYFSSNPSDVTLPAGPSTTIVPYKAESPGSAYNAALGTGIGFVTPLPGVTASFTDTQSIGTWLTTQGTDDESDVSVRARCRSKWATIGLQKPADAYLYLAMNTPGVSVQPTKVKVDNTNPRGPGTLDVWIAGPAGPLSTSDEILVRSFLLLLQSPAADTNIQNASTLSVNVTATVKYLGGFSDAVGIAASGIKDLIDLVDIGGKLQLSDVVKVIVDVDGIDEVDLTTVRINGVFADLSLGVSQLAVAGTINLTGIVV